jgi:hypothetical protein
MCRLAVVAPYKELMDISYQVSKELGLPLVHRYGGPRRSRWRCSGVH